MNQYPFKWTARTVLLAGVLSSAVLALEAQTPPAQAAPPQTPADNTKVNTRDRTKGAVTADQQKENATDRELTQKIRRAVLDDKSLSTYAHNVKIVTQGGKVTLKGPVRSIEEKKTVEAKAVAIAGAGQVINEMSVAPEDPKTVKK
jgi:hyperosmotically inducible periplasmic protein